MIRKILGWEPHTPLREGMRKTYAWIEGEHLLKYVPKRPSCEIFQKNFPSLAKKGRPRTDATSQAIRRVPERQTVPL